MEGAPLLDTLITPSFSNEALEIIARGCQCKPNSVSTSLHSVLPEQIQYAGPLPCVDIPRCRGACLVNKLQLYIYIYILQQSCKQPQTSTHSFSWWDADGERGPPQEEPWGTPWMLCSSSSTCQRSREQRCDRPEEEVSVSYCSLHLPLVGQHRHICTLLVTGNFTHMLMLLFVQHLYDWQWRSEACWVSSCYRTVKLPAKLGIVFVFSVMIFQNYLM